MSSKHSGLFCSLVLLSSCAASFGQESIADQQDLPAQRVTAEMVDAQIKQLGESTDLDEATKTQLAETLGKAKAALQLAQDEQQQVAKFTGWLNSVEADNRDAEAKKQQPAKTYDFTAADAKPLAELTKDLTELERQRDIAKQEFEAAKNEPQRRTQRLQAISDEIAAARKTVEESQLGLEALKQTNAPPIVLEGRKMRLLASLQAANAVIAAREAERRAYEAQGNLPRLRIDIAANRLKQLEGDIEKLGHSIADRRQFDAGEQLKDATVAMAAAPRPLKPLWKNNVVDRAHTWIDLADSIIEATNDRDRISAQLEQWQEDFKKTKGRAETVTSGTIGQLLIRKKSELPEADRLRKEFDARELEIRAVQGRLYDLEDRDLKLTDPAGRASAAAEQLFREHEDLPDDTEQRLVELYTAESLILDQLYDDTNLHFNLLIAANQHLDELINLLDDYAEFIDQRVFWIRSTEPPRVEDLAHASRAIGWLVEPGSWQATGDTFLANLRRDPIRSSLVAVFIGGLFYFRGRARRSIKKAGAIAEPRSCRTFAPTLKALWQTAVVAAGWPLLIYFLGWTIRSSGDELVRAFSDTLSVIAGPLFLVEFTVQVCRAKGLAQSHFAWPAAGVETLKSNLRLLLFAGLPLALVFIVMTWHGTQNFDASLGRFCYVAFMLLVALVCYRIFRSGAGILQTILAQQPDSWLSRLQRVWRIGLILIPLSLSVLALAGFYYTSQRLAEYLLQTVVLIFGLVVLGALLYRWVRVKRRQLRWQQAMEHRERQTAEQGSDASKIAEIVVEEDEVNLAAIDQQTRRLIRSFLFFAGLVGMWIIWSNVFPMLGLLEQGDLWTMRDAAGEPFSITIADVLIAMLVVGITIAAARNIPGLVDILLLQRLRIESSIRYAISTLSQYLIAMIGIAVGAGSLGFSWGKVQWLVAALGVGLGFGLQEIVANFVCGIILLFERPIRVGDVVTLGDTTGVVTKISIRATRIRNWDRQELVIPNKELITGRIVNWTLTDKLNRIVINVGVAYGSDTQRAREVIFAILREQPNVLDDPQPMVTFDLFGDSTLNFTIRAYLSNLDQRLETIHGLHTAIHERFKTEGIEIAFPQRDLHIRSVHQAVEISSVATEPAEEG